MRPIQQIALDMEHVYLSKAYCLARKFCKPCDISAFVTDALVCHPSNVQRQKLLDAAADMRHSDNQPMFRVTPNKSCMVCSTDVPVTDTFNGYVENVCGATIMNLVLSRPGSL